MRRSSLVLIVALTAAGLIAWLLARLGQSPSSSERVSEQPGDGKGRASGSPAPLARGADRTHPAPSPARKATRTPVPAFSFTGHVRSLSPQKPLGGATVQLEGTSEIATTDASGFFELKIRSVPDPAILLARADGYRSVRNAVSRLAGDETAAETDFALPAAPILRGLVLDAASSRPVPNARISFSPRTDSPLFLSRSDPREQGDVWTSSDARGRFSLPVLEPAGWLQAAAPGYSSTRVALRTRFDQAPGPIELLLRPGSGLSGRIVDPAGDPVAKARVRLIPFQQARGILETLSAIDGTYEFEGRTGDQTYRLLVDRAGFVPLLCEPFWLTSGALLQRNDIVLQPAGAIAGTVSTSDGEPVAGAMLHAVLAQENQPEPPSDKPPERGPDRFALDRLYLPLYTFDWARAVTGEDEEFLLPSLAAGIYRVFAYYDTPYSDLVEARTSATTAGIDIVLPDSAQIRGSVQNSRGLPVQGMIVAARPEPQGSSGSRSFPGAKLGAFTLYKAQTDQRGKYAIGPLSPGPYRLLLGLSKSLETGERLVNAPAGNIDLVMPDGPLLQGVVLDAGDRRPVQEFQLKLARPKTLGVFEHTYSLSSADGSFQMESPFTGELSLKVSAPGYTPKTLEPLQTDERGGLQKLSVELRKAPVIQGRVRDENGMAVSGATLRIMSGRLESCSADSGATDLSAQITDRNGRFLLDCASSGPVSISIEHPGHVSTYRDLDLAENPALGDLDIRLQHGLRLRGTVVAQAGQPVSGSVVEAWLHTDPGPETPVRATPIGADGRFELQGLLPGRYTLLVHSAEDWKQLTAKLVLDVQQDVEDLRIEQ